MSPLTQKQEKNINRLFFRIQLMFFLMIQAIIYGHLAILAAIGYNIGPEILAMYSVFTLSSANTLFD